MGPNRLPQFDYLYTLFTTEFLGSTCYCFISLLFTVHDKIIMLMGTWRTTRKISATTRVVWDALS
jgi:hypothetical protein